MKIGLKSQLKPDNEGSAFLMAMLLVIITVPLAVTYLLAAQNQYRSVDRSQSWNAALPAAESGLEEAFAHLNAQCYSNTANGGVLNWDDGGFVSDGTKLTLSSIRYLRTNNASALTYYTLRIVTNSPGVDQLHPDVVCVGYAPSFSAKSNVVARQIRVHTVVDFLYSHGLESSNCIAFNGNGSMTSYDSSDANYSFYGSYDPRYVCVSNASIASIKGCIDLGAHGTVVGPAYTSPFGTGLSGGSIGDSAWISNHTTGYQPGFDHNDYNPPAIEEPSIPTNMVSWTVLTPWNGPITYTNGAITNAFMTSSVYPTDPPYRGLVPSTIRTNTTGLVTTTSWPSTIPAADIITNWLLYTSTTYPSNIVASGIQITTNLSSTTVTTAANTVSNAAPSATPPTAGNYANPPGITTNVLVISNYYAAPPMAGAYLTYCNPVLDANSHVDWYSDKGTKMTNYTYDWIRNYTYSTVGGYSWSNAVYQYVTNVYSFTAARLTNEVQTVNATYAVPRPNTPNINKWSLSSLSLSGSETMVITQPNQQIYVSGSFRTSGQARIILTEGASVSFYFGSDVDISGQGIVNEVPNTALNMQLIGLSTCPSISISGNGQTMAVIDAPHSDITLNGNGSVIGAIIGNSVTVNGNPEIVYDAALRKSGPANGFIATKWIEEPVGTTP